MIVIYVGDNEVVVCIIVIVKIKEEVSRFVKEIEEEILCWEGIFLYGYGEVLLFELVMVMLFEKEFIIFVVESFIVGLF